MTGDSKKIEWVVVGAGIAGITAAEILTRNGHQVLLLEKEEELASDTSALFHEWMHFGSLYTFFPGLNRTLRYVLGGLDDLLEYYSDFENMNLSKSDNGILIKKKGWFSDEKIFFRFKLKNRRLVIPWILGIARSVFLIHSIKSHDWLRRKIGETQVKYPDYLYKIPNYIKKIIFHKNDFFEVETADHLMNSRIIIKDLLDTAVSNGLVIKNKTELKSVKKINNSYNLTVYENGQKKEISCFNLALANSKGIAQFIKANTDDTYAPIVVAKNVNNEKRSFVNLDYFPSTCINSIYKGNGIAMLGGISFKNKADCEPYIEYIINENKKINPNLEPLESYIGVKTEVLFKDEDRNYIYSVVQHEISNIWTLVPGKFSLAFSMAVEFYRKASNQNSQISSKVISKNFKAERQHIKISPHKYHQISSNKD